MATATRWRWLAVAAATMAAIGIARCVEASTAVECTTAAAMHAEVANHENGFEHDEHDAGNHEPHRLTVATVDFKHVQTPFIIALWIFLATLAKIGFHMANKLSSIFPESCLLIVVGVIIGLLLFYTGLTSVSPLTPDTFFLYMLPPIVLDAGYFMPNRLFFDNLGTILLFAVIGTLWNTTTIGLSLWAVGLTGLYSVELSILDTFLFSALISAVDPVAVLAVFEEIQVNEVLYIVVFGESLLNDAVTVVLYHMFASYTVLGESNIEAKDVFTGIASFFVVGLGGTAIGVIWGYLTAFVTRFTNHVRVIEPIFVFVMSYMSYLNAEIFHLSGILAITFCGISMKNYVESNISHKSHTTVKYTMKMIASSSETIIFMFLGVSTVTDDHKWNTWFVVFTILFCTVYRAIGVVVLTAIANRFRIQELNKVEEFVMAYGGLRGAVAFALALTITEHSVSHRHMFVTTTIAVVYFTVFIQGITIKPLVAILGVKKSEKRKVTMNERIHERFMDHIMAGIEDIVGHHGNHHLRDKFKYYDNKYIRRWFVRDHKTNDRKILETFSKLNLKDAMTMVHQSNLCLPRIGTTEYSLANMFKSYTQTNLVPRQLGGKSSSNLLTVHPDPSQSQATLSMSNSNDWNLDMKELDYSPSGKDINEANLHHILSDAMFKPVRRYRKYSRSQIHEPENHPPFHHKMRMQIRHLLSEQNKHKRFKDRKRNGQLPSKNALQNGTAKIPQYVISCPEDEDGDGIIFQAHTDELDDVFVSSHDGKTKGFFAAPSAQMSLKPGHLPIRRAGFVPRPLSFPVAFRTRSQHYPDIELRQTSSLQGFPSGPPSPPPPQTITESQLPWKHDEGQYVYAQPRPQQEFPSWIDNKEYISYMSPTSTFLSGLDSSPVRTPVFEVFERLDEINEEGTSQQELDAKEFAIQPTDAATNAEDDGVSGNQKRATMIGGSSVDSTQNDSVSSPAEEDTVVDIDDIQTYPKSNIVIHKDDTQL